MENLTKKISKHSFIAQIGEKFGAVFYDPKINSLLEIARKTKGAITNTFENLIDNISVGFTPENATYVDVGIPFIRAQDIDKNGNIDLEDSKRITILHHENSQKSKVKYNDILLVITGATVGKTALFDFKDREANINQNIVKISIKQEIVSPNYMLYFLKSKIAQVQLIRNAQRLAQEYLNYPAMKSIYIIYPKNIKKQEQIVKKVKKIENKAKEKLKEYYKTTQEFGKFFLDKLNIKLNVEKKEPETFLFNLANSSGNRIDCYSHSAYYDDIIEKLKKNQKIDKLINGKDLNILEDKIKKNELEEIETQKFKYVEVKHTTKSGTIKGCKEDILFNLPSRAKQVIKTNDILLPRPIGSTEQIAIVPQEYNNQLCSTGFIVIRPENYEHALILWAILKSDLIQKQLFYLQSGSLQPEITPVNFKEKIIIPIPNKRIQNEIIKIIKDKIVKSNKILKEANNLFAQAEKEFIDSLKN